MTHGALRRRTFCALALTVAGGLLNRPGPLAAARRQPPLVLPRADWGAAPPGTVMRPHTVERITVHHTGPPSWYGSPPAPAYLRAIHAFHQGPERGWPDIAYHLLIDLDGAVWEGRALAFAGDTATDYDPTGHALVAVLGDYDEQRLNQAQLDALVAAARWLADTYRLDAGALGAHRDYAATACPGRSLYASIEAIRAAL